MARKYQSKSDVIASPTNNNDKLVKAALFKVDIQGNIKSNNINAKFLLNPSSLEDVKSNNWVENNIPGQSDPVLQWVSGGPRNLNFTALVTKDTIHESPKVDKDPIDSLVDTAINAVGSLASTIAGINIPAVSTISALFTSASDTKGTELSIARHLNYYRSLMYPDIDQSGILVSSPPLVVFALGKTLNSLHCKNVTGKIDAKNTDIWIIKNVSIRVTKWLPNLDPMEAEVSFQCVQYNIESKSSGLFPN